MRAKIVRCYDCRRQAAAYVASCLRYAAGMPPSMRRERIAISKVAAALHDLHAASSTVGRAR